MAEKNLHFITSPTFGRIIKQSLCKDGKFEFVFLKKQNKKHHHKETQKNSLAKTDED
jgi:hypothetical protein